MRCKCVCENDKNAFLHLGKSPNKYRKNILENRKNTFHLSRIALTFAIEIKHKAFKNTEYKQTYKNKKH